MALNRDKRPAAQAELGNVVPAVMPTPCEGQHDWKTTNGMGIFRCATCFVFGFARTKPGKYFQITKVRAYRCQTPNCRRDARLKGPNWTSTNATWFCERHGK